MFFVNLELHFMSLVVGGERGAISLNILSRIVDVAAAAAMIRGLFLARRLASRAFLCHCV